MDTPLMDTSLVDTLDITFLEPFGMDAAGRAVVWCAVQVTLVLAAALLLDAAVRRRGPALRSLIGCVALTTTVALALLALSPWPNWQSMSAAPSSGAVVGTESETRTDTDRPQSADAPTEAVAIEPAAPLNPSAADETESAWAAAWRAFRDELQASKPSPATTPASASASQPPSQPPSQARKAPLGWPGVVAWCYLALLVLGVMRWAAGLVLLRRVFRHAVLLEDAALRSLADELAGTLGVRRRVALYESSRLGGPATTGWLRPVILLPSGWRDWSETQRRAVLAHELAHVRRRDALAWLLAELGRTLHAYHPLAHWLAARTRLHQELAADAEAAALSGGPRTYLHVLAGMALAQPDRSVRWPARAFLPSRSALLRSVDMLRQGKLPNVRTPLPWRLAAAGGLIALAVAAAGLRGAVAQVEDDDRPAEPRPNQPANPPSDDEPKPDVLDALFLNAAETEGGHPQPFNLDLVPESALAVVGIRPAVILGRPEFEPLLKIMKQGGQMQTPFGVPVDSIEQIVFSLRADPVLQRGSRGGERQFRPGEPEFIGATIRVRGKLDQKAVVEALGPEVEPGFYGGQLYLKDRNGRGAAFWFLDEHTFAVAPDEANLRRMIDARNTPGRVRKGAPGWETARNGTLAVLIYVGLARRTFGDEALRAGAAGINAMFAPLWNDTETLVGRIGLNDKLNLSLTFAADSRDESKYVKAKRIQETLEAKVTIGKNMVRQNRLMVQHLPEDEQAAARGLLAMADGVLGAIEVEQGQNASVELRADLGEEGVHNVVTMLIPAVIAARQAAQRTEAMNDLKQIGIAMHNYHDIFKHFPPPVVIGPDGKTPHSWRVELLPFLEQNDLFQRYRMDEPWDSEHNMKLLREMPAVFRHPMDDKDSVHTSYFGLDGLNTLFDLEVKDGVPIRSITDGTSNTLMVVEAKKAVPWTKPEDIPYDPKGKLPELGGWFDEGFLAVFGDGSAHFISEDIGDETLRRLIERNDGQTVELHRDFPQPAAEPARPLEFLPPPRPPQPAAPATDIPPGLLPGAAPGPFGAFGGGFDSAAPPTAPDPFSGSAPAGEPANEEPAATAPAAPQAPKR